MKIDRSLLLLSFLVVFCAVPPGCSDSGTDGFSDEAAKDLALRFHQAMVKGDTVAAAGLARVPFRYKDAKRVWPDAGALQKNLAKEIPRIQHLLKGLDQVEVFSRRDLAKGKWPRGREVPESQRDAEIAALGVLENGFLARVHSESKAGYYLVINPDGEKLAVQALDI